MLGMCGKKDLKAKLLYVGLIKMCVGRFLFFLSQMFNRRTNVVLAYNGRQYEIVLDYEAQNYQTATTFEARENI